MTVVYPERTMNGWRFPLRPGDRVTILGGSSPTIQMYVGKDVEVELVLKKGGYSVRYGSTMIYMSLSDSYILKK